MSRIFQFDTHSDKRGFLTVIEKEIPFAIKRVFYIYGVDESKRGFHKHIKTRQLAVCIKGSCNIIFSKDNIDTNFTLNNPQIGLLIEPEDFHWMENFSEDAILLVLASEYFDENDYIYKNEN